MFLCRLRGRTMNRDTAISSSTRKLPVIFRKKCDMTKQDYFLTYYRLKIKFRLNLNIFATFTTIINYFYWLRIMSGGTQKRTVETKLILYSMCTKTDSDYTK